MTQAALDLYEVHRADFLRAARAAADKHLEENETITIDDVREVCPPPAGIDPRVYGAVFNTDDYECVGYRKSTRKECHNRPIGIFRKKSKLPVNWEAIKEQASEGDLTLVSVIN